MDFGEQEISTHELRFIHSYDKAVLEKVIYIPFDFKLKRKIPIHTGVLALHKILLKF